MIDIHTEDLFPVNEIPRRAPGRPHRATGWRWVQKGCRGVKLESILCGGSRMTSVQALDRFFQAVTAAADGKSTVTSTTPAAARKRHEQANRELDAAGI